MDDIALYFDLLGIPAALDGAEVMGIFDNGYMEALGGINTRQPSFRLASANTFTTTRASTLAVEGAVYRVKNIELDGLGTTVLMLELQP